jgi:hypothetical protein
MRPLQLRFLVLVGIATFLLSAILLAGLSNLIPDNWPHPDWLFDAAVYTSLAVTAIVVAWFVRREGRKNREDVSGFMGEKRIK